MTDDSAEDPAAVVGNDRANQHTHGGMQFIYSFCLGNPMKDVEYTQELYNRCSC